MYGLDPKRVSAFNPSTTCAHFELLGKVLSSYNIQACNCYNVNEKGLQLGGGRKNLLTQFIFLADDRQHYALWSDLLVLVTLIEAVCAYGSSVPPVFILPKGSIGLWWEVPGVGS